LRELPEVRFADGAFLRGILQLCAQFSMILQFGAHGHARRIEKTAEI
jgi:hypothetical protein